MLLQLEEDVRFELKGREVGSLNVSLSSEEILQTYFGGKILALIDRHYPAARTQFLIRTEQKAIEQVLDGEVHMAFVTYDPPPDVVSKVLGRVEFRVCASKKHPLIKKFGEKQSFTVEEVLKYSFAAPDSAILGRITKSTSIDGWRDDKFPRQIKYKVCGLKLLENLIQDGTALGYLPDYFIESSGLIPLKVTGCPYTCHQTVRIIAKDPSLLGWLNKLWDQL